ncbi:right-handed parallel beta-helix repeat-containing protein [Candidatus Micrarchaeota archaeon]|nr:right-handed parallel beta-helix repeat-containing protein [Candidatus Micrarchaeota archaeon]
MNNSIRGVGMNIKITFLFIVLMSFIVFSDFDLSGFDTSDYPQDDTFVDDTMNDNCGDIVEIDTGDNDSFTLTDDYDNGTCFKITGGSDEFTFDCDGHYISGAGDNDGRVAIYVYNADKVTITDCEIKEIQYGIIFLDSAHGTVDDCNVHNIQYGIYFGVDSESIEKDNTVKGHSKVKNFLKAGIWMDHVKESLIDDNTVEDGLIPIYMSASQDSEIKNNDVKNAEFTGIGINNSKEINIYKNSVEDTGTDTYGDGIGLLNSEDCKVHNNDIKNAHDSGIALFSNDEKENCEVYNNDISESACGITFGMDKVNSYSNDIDDNDYGLCFADLDDDNLEGCTVENTTLTSSNDKDVYVFTDNVKGSNILRNVDFDEDDVDCDGGVDDSKLTIEEYVTLKIIDSNEDPIEDAEVTLKNGNDDKMINKEDTDNDGEVKGITTRGVYSFDGGDTDYDDYKDHEVDIKYGGQTYDEDVEIDHSGTFTIKLEEVTLHQKNDIGGQCSSGLDCKSGYCCDRGVYKNTCRASEAQCPNYECLSDDDCEDDEKCDNHKCVEITGTCGYAENHEWIEYECCNDTECEDNEVCQDHECTTLNGTCGYAENHTWINYTCCEDDDCADDEKCEDHDCIKITGTNGYAKNHTWVYYECTSNYDCEDDEVCENHECVEIEQDDCGHIVDHEWVDYECCTNEDCGENQVCKDHECKDKICGCAPALLILMLGFFVFKKQF